MEQIAHRLIAVCILLLVPSSVRADGVSREQRHGVWRRTVTGTVKLSGKRLFKVITTGRVVVEPTGQRDEIAYQWVLQVRAADQAAAERRMDPCLVRNRLSGQWCSLFAEAPPDISSDLTVRLPKNSGRCVVETRQGGIEVRGFPGDLEVATQAGNIDLDSVGGSAVVRTGGGGVKIGSISGSLRCLSGGGTLQVDSVGAEAVLESAGGEIFLKRAGGPARLSTAGNIHVGDARSSVSARTTGGLIDVESAGDTVTVETTGGAIVIGGARGVFAQSAGGPIKMRQISGPVRASTVLGSIYLEYASTAAVDNSLVSATAGDITVTLPSNLAVTVKAVNESPGWRGRIVSEFPEIRARQEWAGMPPLVAQGSLNGGGGALVLTVSNGSIYLKRNR